MTEQKKKKGPPLRRIAREWAVRYLYQLDVSDDKISDVSLAWFWNQLTEDDDQLGDREIAKCQRQALELINGVLSTREELDVYINREAMNWDIERIATVDRNILRLGAFEICHNEKVPGPVAINEALEVCRSFGGGEESRPFINGILDKILRKFEAGELADG